MANPNFRAPDSPAGNNGAAVPGVPAGGAANGNAAANGAANGVAAPGARAASTPLDRLIQREREHAVHAAPREGEDENGESLALYDEEIGRAPGGAIENADDAALREFYGRLVTLLTQDSAEAPRKKKPSLLVTALKRRWFVALIVVALGFYGLYRVLKPKQVTYTAGATLLLPPRERGANVDPFASPEDSYDTQAQMAIIGSEKIVKSAMARVPHRLRAKGWGDRNATLAGVNVNSLGSDSLISISTSSLDANASLALVNEMVRAYIAYARDRYASTRTGSLTNTKASLKKAASDLDKARAALRDYKKRTGIFDAQSAQSSSAAHISDLESSLGAARRDAATAVSTDSTLTELRQRAQDANVSLQNILRDFEPGAERARVAQAAASRAQAQVGAREDEIARASQDRIAQLQQSLSVARSNAQVLPDAERNLSRLNQQVALADAAYRSAATRATQLGLARGTVVPTATILHSPGVGSDRTMQRARALAVSLIGALLLGILCALLVERLDNSVRAVREPDELFGAPVLGALPAMRSRRGTLLGAQSGSTRKRTATLDACYTAQNHILAAASAIGARSILLTSSVPEEGKSQCAANLAAAMAYGGRQVLLIDCDFWHPSQHEIFERELGPGYAQVLRGEIPISQAIRPTNVPNLFLLTAGRKVALGNKAKAGEISGAEITALLSGESHYQTQEVLKNYFDVILVDAPPAMSVVDAQLLTRLTDATVLVAAARTNRDQVQRARSMLRLASAVLLGVVINSVRLGEVQRWTMDFSPEEPFSNYSTSLSKR